MGWLIQDAWAQTEGMSDPFLSLLPLVLIFAVFYFLLIRPQNKRQKEHKALVANISVGDECVTAGGVLGKVTQVDDQFIRVQVADGRRAQSPAAYDRSHHAEGHHQERVTPDLRISDLGS